jgi:hypothetical protein
MDRDALQELLAKAEADPVAQTTREQLAQTLAQAFARVGSQLWVGGSIVGGDRVAGMSPFAFGSDATVGLATVAQIAGELTAGTVTLLKHDNLYAAAALVRQLVEVEYLAWAFGADEKEAERWLRSTPDQRRKMWQPRHLRDRSNGLFRGSDYAGHCERGGHPTPTALRLMSGHESRESAAGWWSDLCMHATSVWQYLSEATPKYGWGDHVPTPAIAETVRRVIQLWEAKDGLLSVVAEIRQSGAEWEPSRNAPHED